MSDDLSRLADELNQMYALCDQEEFEALFAYAVDELGYDAEEIFEAMNDDGFDPDSDPMTW